MNNWNLVQPFFRFMKLTRILAIEMWKMYNNHCTAIINFVEFNVSVFLRSGRYEWFASAIKHDSFEVLAVDSLIAVPALSVITSSRYAMDIFDFQWQWTKCESIFVSSCTLIRYVCSGWHICLTTFDCNEKITRFKK